MMKLAVFLVVVGVVSLLATACSDDDGDTVKIGVLLPDTGALSSYGEASRATLEMAKAMINEDSDLKIELVYRDTATEREATFRGLEELDDEGVSVVIGPYASSSVETAKDYADQHGIILISPLSTAGPLAIPGDNIYRFTPDEVGEGEAVAAVAVADGIETIIAISRDDPGNVGLRNAMRNGFTGRGGTVVEGPNYPANEDDFPGLVAEIVALLEAPGIDLETTAVFLAAFGEVRDLFVAASESNEAVLKEVIWYGSDSVAQSADLIEDPVAGAYAASLTYPNPILGLRDEDRSLWEPVVASVTDEIGRAPDTFALAAYDALVVAHKAIVAAGADASAEALGAALVAAAESHTGLTGPAVLNEAGDRSGASFDFWSVCEAGAGTYTWVRTINYAPDPDGGEGTITRNEC